MFDRMAWETVCEIEDVRRVLLDGPGGLFGVVERALAGATAAQIQQFEVQAESGSWPEEPAMRRRFFMWFVAMYDSQLEFRTVALINRRWQFLVAHVGPVMPITPPRTCPRNCRRRAHQGTGRRRRRGSSRR